MPAIARLVDRDHHRVLPIYSGVPSVTPAVQAELFYGVRGAVPAFSFVRRRDGRLVRMYEPDVVHELEQAVRAHADAGPPLLAGGSSYGNVYDGGAAQARFCIASLGPGPVLATAHPWARPVVLALHVGDLVRLGWHLLREVAVAPADLVAALRAGEHRPSELKFVQARLAVNVVLRDLLITGARIDLARGVPVVYVNLLGYDEWAHRRGPDAHEALRSLVDLDRAVARVERAATHATRRLYDVWVLSDHGQEATLPWVEVHGRRVHEVVGEVFARHGLVRDASAVDGSSEPSDGEQAQRVRQLGERLGRWLVPGLDLGPRHRDIESVTVAAMGPLGHVYAPRSLERDEVHAVAVDLVAAGVPLVLAARRSEHDTADAWNAAGRWTLPDDAASVLGADHPYLAEATADLVAVCHHGDAGDLVLSGWRRDGLPASFPHEHGSHSGPGPQETDAFLVAPHDVPLPRRPGPWRPTDVRIAAMATLRGERAIGDVVPPPPRRSGCLRVMTYNIHYAIGMDERVSVERIARVIAAHDPDVVALQEVDVERARTGGLDQVRRIADHLEMALEFHPTITVADERFGDAVLSRLPMRRVRDGALPALAGRADLEPRGVLWVEIDVDGTPVTVMNTHLSIHPRERAMQARALAGADWLRHPDAGERLILCGDFNAPVWSPSQRVLQRVVRDAAASSRPRDVRTWSGRLRLLRIDHVYLGAGVAVDEVWAARDARSRVASDHLPLVADLRVR